MGKLIQTFAIILDELSASCARGMRIAPAFARMQAANHIGPAAAPQDFTLRGRAASDSTAFRGWAP